MNQLYFDMSGIETIGHETFSSYASGFIDVFYNKLLTGDNINYLLYGLLVLLLIVFAVNFIFQNNK